MAKAKYLWAKINQFNVNIIIPIKSSVILKYNNRILLLSYHLEEIVAQLESLFPRKRRRCIVLQGQS